MVRYHILPRLNKNVWNKSWTRFLFKCQLKYALGNDLIPGLFHNPGHQWDIYRLLNILNWFLKFKICPGFLILWLPDVFDKTCIYMSQGIYKYICLHCCIHVVISAKFFISFIVTALWANHIYLPVPKIKYNLLYLIVESFFVYQ